MGTNMGHDCQGPAQLGPLEIYLLSIVRLYTTGRTNFFDADVFGDPMAIRTALLEVYQGAEYVASNCEEPSPLDPRDK